LAERTKPIYVVLNGSEVTDEELITGCTRAENLLDFRPLTYQSEDAKDDVPLTPNYWHMGGQIAPETVDTTEFNSRKPLQKVQELISQVRKRWMRGYLHADAEY